MPLRLAGCRLVWVWHLLGEAVTSGRRLGGNRKGGGGRPTSSVIWLGLWFLLTRVGVRTSSAAGIFMSAQELAWESAVDSLREVDVLLCFPDLDAGLIGFGNVNWVVAAVLASPIWVV